MSILDLQKELLSIKEITIKELRELVLNPAYNEFIDSDIHLQPMVKIKLIHGLSDEEAEKMRNHFRAINFYIDSRIVFGIRKRPEPTSTPLSAFEFEGHNETGEKILKNSVQVNIF